MGEVVTSTTTGRWVVGDAVAILDRVRDFELKRIPVKLTFKFEVKFLEFKIGTCAQADRVSTCLLIFLLIY